MPRSSIVTISNRLAIEHDGYAVPRKRPIEKPLRQSPSPGKVPAWALVLFLVALAVYVALFYQAELGELTFSTAEGRTFHPPRYALLAYLLDPSMLVKPWFGEPPSFSVFDRAPLLLLAGVIALFAGFAGRLAMQLVGADRGLTRTELIVFSLGVGLNLTSTYVLILGLMSAIGSPLVSVMFAVPAALSIALGQRIWARRSDAPVDALAGQTPNSPDAAGSNRGLSPKWMWLAVPAAMAIVLGGVLPPVDFDVREYHLNVPKEFFLQGRVAFLPHNVYGNMPLGGELLALLAMVLRDDWWSGALVGKALLACFAPLTAILLYAAGVRWYGVTAGVVAAVVYLTTPWVAKVATSGLIEATSAFYLFAAVYAAALWRHTPANAEPQTGRLLLAGYLAGGAVAVKYPAVLFVLLPLGAFVAIARSGAANQAKQGWPSVACIARRTVLFGSAALLACGLWFAKNVYFTGNPTYPLLANVFESPGRTPELIQRWGAAHDPPNYAISDLLSRAIDVLGRSPWHSPLIVPLAVLSLLAIRRQGLTRALWGYVAFVLLAWWLATHRIDRFWVPLLPVMALLAGIGAAWSSDRRWLRLVAVLLACGASVNFLFIPGGPDGYTRYFVPLEQLRIDPNRLDPWHAWINTHVPRDEAVLLVGDAQAFDIERTTYYNTTFDQSIFERWVKDRSPAEIREKLAECGVGFVYVDWGEINRYRSPGNYGFTDFVTPEVFARLRQHDVLARPWPSIPGHAGQMFPVQTLPREDRDE